MAEVSISHFKRSFCTNMYNLGLPILTIMAFSGHKTEKNIRKYTKSKNEDHRKIMMGIGN
jgi:predicted metal-dependent RNase